MKKLLILSGKGGTGKTTTASAFIEFSKATAFADCDVDAPNLHLISKISSDAQFSDFYGSQKAIIDSDKCTKCGLCKTNCQFDAIEYDNSQYKINQFACEGCGTCEYNCPSKAITMVDDVAGKLALYKDDKVFSTATLKMGRGNSGLLVTDVKSALYKNTDKNDKLAIIDGSPGIGCPVIASITGVDMVLIITEPSLSGMSDMKRILKTIQIFNIKACVCINKYDICTEISDEIESFCKENDIFLAGKIPYDENVSKAINNGDSIAKYNCPAKDALQNIYNKIITILEKE